MADILKYEELLPLFAINGQCETQEYSPVLTGGGVFTPNNHIQIGQAWRVKFDWNTTGFLNYLIAGKFELRVFLEQMGGGEFNLPNATKIVNVVSSPNAYSDTIEVSAAVSANIPAGVYKLVSALTMKGPGGVAGPIAAFAEGPMVQFYKVG